MAGRKKIESHWKAVRDYYETKGPEYVASVCGCSVSRVYQIASALGIKRGFKRWRIVEERTVPESVRRFWERRDAMVKA